VFEIKIDKSKLSNQTLQHLNQWFTQGKYFYNYCLSHDNIDKANTTIKVVPVKVLDKFEESTEFTESTEAKFKLLNNSGK
jgi:hypothetical protein